MMNMKKHPVNWLVLLVAACILVRVVLIGIAAWVHPNGLGSLYWDIDAKRYYEVAGLSPQERAQTLSWDAPLFQEVISLPLHIFSNHAAVPVVFNVAVFVLSAGLVFVTAGYLFGRKSAWWSTALFVSYPSFFVYSILPFPDPLFILLFIAAVYFLVRLLRESRFVFALGAGMSAGFCILTKESAVFLPGLFCMVVILTAGKKYRRAVCAGVLMLVTCSFVVMPSLIHNKLSFGEFTISGKMTKYFKFLHKVRQRSLPVSVMRGDVSLTAGAIGVPPSNHVFSWLTDYVMSRRQFFFGTGTISLMRICGLDTRSLEKIPFRAGAYLSLLQENGYPWVVFQVMSWIYIIVLYCLAIGGFITLIVDKQIALATLFFLCIVYFLGVYFWNFNARHFTILIPSISLISGAFLKGNIDERAL